jgi:hypothetical protein
VGFYQLHLQGCSWPIPQGPQLGPTNDGPTKENALEAEKELGQAMRTNDADGFCRLVAAVVNGIGGLDEGVGIRGSICAAIKAGVPLREKPTR